MVKKTKWVGVFFLLVIFLMLLRVAAAFIPLGSEFLRKEFSESAVDTLDIYLYAGTDDVGGDVPADAGFPVSRAYAAFNKLKSLVTDYMSPNQAYFMEFVIGKRMIDRTMGLDMTASMAAGEVNENYGDVAAVWQDDYLGYVAPDAVNEALYESVAVFGRQMEKESRNFLFFMSPAKQTSTVAYPDHSKELRQQLLQVLREQRLSVINVMDVITERQMDMEDLFFKTDHHWLPSAGIWADGLLCEFMNENYGYHIDTSVFDPENYDTTIIEESILGSIGRKVTTAYCSKEDFPVVVPRYDTNLNVFIPGKNRTFTGSIQDTLFDYENLEASVSDPYGNDAYSSYICAGQFGLIMIHNNDIHDGSRVLVIKTSFADVMVPYLSAVVEDLYVLDIALFDGSPRALIDETDPDTVIIVAGSERLENFDFSDVIED